MTTPPLKIGASGSGSPGTLSVAAERLVSNTGSVELPPLTKTNYHEWSLVMQVSLEALGLWKAVKSVSTEHREDRLALAAILRGVPSEMKARLTVKKSTKEAWAAVKEMRVGDDRVKSANVQRLLKEFENVAFHDGESVDDFAMRINGLVASLHVLGEAMEDSRVVKKILRVVSRKMKQVAVAIEMLTDLNNTSVEELVGRLRVAEDADSEEAADGVGRLFLTEEQWEVRRRQCGGKERARGGDGRRGSGERDVGRSGGHGKDDEDASSTSSGASRCHRGRCFNCGVRGHLARNCREPKKERALLADVDEERCLL